MRKLLISICMICALTVNAQHDPSQSAELKTLEFLLGDWDVEINSRLSKNGPWEKSMYRSTITKAIGNTVYEESLTGIRTGKEYIAKGWMGNDNRTKLFQRIFVDSNHGVLYVYEGKWQEDELILEYDFLLNQIPLKLRFVYSNIKPDSFMLQSMRSTDSGLTWDKTGESIYTRKTL